MREKNTYLFYGPPKSNSHGQILKSKNHLDSASTIANIVNDKTGFKSVQEINIAFHTDYYKNDLYDRKQMVDHISKDFGEAKEIPNSDPSDYMLSKFWSVPFPKLEEVIKFYLNNYHPNLFFSYSYNRENINSRSHSMFTVVLTNNQFRVMSSLHLPYNLNSPKCFSFIKDLSSLLPFKLNPKHLRVTTDTKNESFVYRKLDKDLEAKIGVLLSNN
jgi:hypothetical protein